MTAAADRDDRWKVLGLAAPARRALTVAHVHALEDLTHHRRSAIADLHGMGPNAMQRLDVALRAQGLAFRS